MPAAASSHATRPVALELNMEIRRFPSGCPLIWARFDLFTDYSPNKPVYAPIATRIVRNIGFFSPINSLSNYFPTVYCNPLSCQGGCIRIHCRLAGQVHKMLLILISLVMWRGCEIMIRSSSRHRGIGAVAEFRRCSIMRSRRCCANPAGLVAPQSLIGFTQPSVAIARGRQ